MQRAGRAGWPFGANLPSTDSTADPGAARLENSDRIAFVTSRHGGPNLEIYVMDADGSNVVRLTDGAGRDTGPTWSPDGTKIAFARSTPGDDGASNFDVYVVNVDGSNEVNLTDDPAVDWEPTWSPDGARIAFSSDRDGNLEVYVMDADGSNPLNLTRNPAADGQPAWWR